MRVLNNEKNDLFKENLKKRYPGMMSPLMCQEQTEIVDWIIYIWTNEVLNKWTNEVLT